MRARVKALWQKYWDTIGIVSDDSLPHKQHIKIYSTVIRPVFVNEADAVAVKRTEEHFLVRTEVRFVRRVMRRHSETKTK